jgi:TonB-linked SusC/RagA family outer membrane protein
MSASCWRSASLLVSPLLALAPGAGGLAPAPLGAQQPAAQAAQQVTVRGRVLVAESGDPVVGANVVARGTSPVIGTQTNERGEFSLRLPSATFTLVVSRIGFAQDTVALNGRTDVEIRLSRNALALSEVVVVGYGTQRRSDITGSVTSITPQRLEDKPNVSVEQALQGALPGVNVTMSSAGAEGNLNIQIRGRNSISANTAPLVVVDGIPYNGSITEINPNDVASIEVLKDASSTAIYGARGSNGVILITSKRGATGKPQVSYNGYAGTSQYANLPRLMNAQEFADFKCVRINNGTNCNTALTQTEQRNLAAGVNTSWLDLATRTGNQQQHDVSVRGGSDDTKYYLGGAYLKVNGIANNDQIDRYTVRANLDQRLARWMTIGTNSQVSQIDRSGLAASFENAFFANPLVSPYEADGSTIAVIPWPEDPVTNNALEPLLAVNDDLTRRLFSSNYAQVTVPGVSGLTLRVNAGLDVANAEQGTYWGVNTQNGRAVQGRAQVRNNARRDWTWENVLRYQRGFGRHNLDLTGLYSRQGSTTDNDGLNGQGYPNDVLNYRSTVPLLTTPVVSYVHYDLVSQMGRLNYGFDDRYLATFTVRRDGYSGFGANNKYGVFPSFALAWNVNNEAFFPWKEQVTAFKLRASYGRNGNQAINAYQTLSQLDDRSYLNGETAAPGYIPVTLGNPNLKWETTTSANFGVDLGLFNDRVRATVDAYSSRTRDLLLRRSISSVHGITTIFQNIGRTANRGLELQLQTVNVDRGGFEWSSDFNISANRNEILDLYGDGKDDIASGWFIGRPITVNFEYQFDGIWQQGDNITGSAQPTAKPGDVKIKDVNGDGKISPEDRTFVGNAVPDYIASLGNTVRYKRLSLSAIVNTVQGVTRPNVLLGTNQVFSDVRRNTVYRQYWTPENPINTYPANSNTSNPLSIGFYEDASFVRLRDLTLSYNLSPSRARRVGASSLRAYVNGRNLWTSTKWTGLDPELSATSNQSANQRAIPLERLWTGGVNVGF